MSLLDRVKKAEELERETGKPATLEEVRDRLVDAPAEPFVPEWRRRQVDELARAGGRLVATKELGR